MANSNEYMKMYMKNRRLERRAKIIETLGSKCIVCSSQEELEIDHIDPNSKSFTLSGKSLDKAWSKIQEELDKCQLLCKTHHQEKTSQYSKDQVGHGSEWMYLKYRCRCSYCVDNYSTKRKTYPSRCPVAQ